MEKTVLCPFIKNICNINNHNVKRTYISMWSREEGEIAKDFEKKNGCMNSSNCFMQARFNGIKMNSQKKRKKNNIR